MHVLILGCGYTGRRVAKRFLARGARVTATTRDPAKQARLGVETITLHELPAHVQPEMLVLHSIPPEGAISLHPLRDYAARVVYLSTTGVYGAASLVDETTPVDPSSERAQRRLAAEREVLEGPWSPLILRPAAIYGPGRGIQESIQRGPVSLSDHFVSRIHVDDLATHAEAALLSNLSGAYPVADEEPCTSREIAEFCAGLLQIPLPPAGKETRFATNRKVDGSAIRKALGIELLYPSYRVGIPACLRESGLLVQ